MTSRQFAAILILAGGFLLGNLLVWGLVYAWLVLRVARIASTDLA